MLTVVLSTTQKMQTSNRTAVTIGISSVTGKPVEQIILPATTGILPSVRVLCTEGDKQPRCKSFQNDLRWF